jgi:hypothetical protein
VSSKKVAEFISNLPVDFLIIIILTLSLSSGFVSLSGNTILVQFGIDEFTSQYEGWIGLTFILSTASLLSIIVLIILRSTRKRINEINERQEQKKKHLDIVNNLSIEEQRILFHYLLKNTRTQYFNVMNGVVGGLKNKGLLQLVTEMGNYRSTAFNISPWVWRLIKENPEKVFSLEFLCYADQEIIKLAKDVGISEDDIKELMKEIHKGMKYNIENSA